MKDFLGRDLKVGDEVVFVQLDYRNLLKGKIKSMTAKTILIGHAKTNVCSKETKQTPAQVVKIMPPVMNHLEMIMDLEARESQ